MKRVSIIGLGYIGLPTAILSAQAGYNVFGYDTNHAKITAINKADTTIIDPEVRDRLLHVLTKKNFTASTQLEYADCFVIAVPTPIDHKKKADLTYVWQAAKSIAERIMPGNIVIIESTIPVGLTRKLGMMIQEESGLLLSKDFFVAHCPERAIPGKIFQELIENDRIIGGVCQKSCDLAQSFYTKFVKGMIHITDDKMAEMVKLIENSYRDVCLAFANQVHAMAQESDLNVYQLINLANKHPRVNILSPSCGVGGHCISVDPWFLIESFPKSTALLHLARILNDKKPDTVLQEIQNSIHFLQKSGTPKPRVLVLGLSFKPDVNDLRESPAMKIATALSHDESIDLVTYDPHLTKDQKEQESLPFSRYTLEKEISLSDIIVILVKHTLFFRIDQGIFKNKLVIDTCGYLYDHEKKKANQSARINFNFENISF